MNLLRRHQIACNSGSMILDTLSQTTHYQGLHPLFEKAFHFLQTLGDAPAEGRHDLAGDACFALVQRYETKAEADALFEAHRKYIDIQYLHQGRETIQWAPLTAMQDLTLPYDTEKDVALWKLTAEGTPLRMQAGQVAILFPQDAHAPCLHWGAASEVLKIVIKVAVNPHG
jgi:biofilm protein TabA